MGRGDIYLQPDAADPVLSAATVLRFALAHAGRADAVTGVDESGGEARVYLVDDELVVKTQRPHRVRPRTSLPKEAHLLAHLAETLPGAVPSVFGYDRVDTPEGSVEYLVMSRVVGRAARHVSVTGPARTRLLHTLGRLLRRLHTQPTDGLVGGLFPTDADAGALRYRLELALADLVEEIAIRSGCWPLAVRPETVADRALSALPARLDAPTVLHSNPGQTHAFVDGDGRFTGLIDFGDSYLSHPALDLRSWPAPSDRVALREGYLDGEAPQGDFEAVWTVAMIQADLRAITGTAELAGQAHEDLLLRLAHL